MSSGAFFLGSEVWTLGTGDFRLLVVDNYDSFTYNLVQALVPLGVTIEVIRNDVLSVDQLLERDPGAIVLSPGPGRPEDAGVCVELVRRRAPVPLLGVCLGHQALGQAFGATVDRAPTLMHGKTSKIEVDDVPIFAQLPRPFEATRYHSLRVVEESLPDELMPIAWSEDGVLMAMVHRELPYVGLQFHPESVLTTDGPMLLENFVELARRNELQPAGFVSADT